MSEGVDMNPNHCEWEGLSPPYATIVADPPWPYPEGFAGGHSGNDKAKATPVVTKPLPYSAMSLGEIVALPVRALAAPDCRLFLWTTNRYIPDAFSVMAKWGFSYRQTLVWHKTFVNMPSSVAPNSAEFLLVGVVGNPVRLTPGKSGVIAHAGYGRGGGHSKKPEAFIDLAERVSPSPRVELFARRPRLGWDSWGFGYEQERVS